MSGMGRERKKEEAKPPGAAKARAEKAGAKFLKFQKGKPTTPHHERRVNT
jgi:hypothetical protein